MRTSLARPTSAKRGEKVEAPSGNHNLTDEGLDHWRQRAMWATDFDRGGERLGGSFGRRDDTSFTPTMDAYAERGLEPHGPRDLLVTPPEPGMDAAFDAKVAAEYFRLRGSRAGDDVGTSRAAKEMPPDNARGSGSPNCTNLGRSRDFESDVEQVAKYLGYRGKGGLAVSPPPPPQRANHAGSTAGQEGPQPSSVPNRTPSASQQTSGDDDSGGILSRMDAYRMPQGRGKGRSGGLKNMWLNGEEGYISGNGDHQRHGGGLAEMWKVTEDAKDGSGEIPGVRQSFSRRHGPGIKSMWVGDDREPASGFRPPRQGLGLRALWSGPDTAAGDAAKSDAQAAYLRALDRDAHERQAISGQPPPIQQQQQRWERDMDKNESSPGDDFEGVGFRVSVGRGRRRASVAGEHGARLARMGALSDVSTSPGASRWPWDMGGNEDRDRMFDRAKKAAYGEELRKQMAEDYERKAAEKRASSRVHHRASTGYAERQIATPQEYGFEPGTRLMHHPERNSRSPISGSGQAGVSDNWRPPSSVAGSSPVEQHSPGPANVRNNDPYLTVARRRLVEDVYGGDGMGAALRGSGYRRRSVEGCGTVSKNIVGVADPDLIERESGNSVAAAAATSRGAMHLRTGAGMQSLNDTDQGEKLQKRAAALEQQRALEEQIAANARTKKEEDEKRKREEEEEARQQQERLRQMEAEAEEERRRKQAEQQAQLDGLYRQQEEALRKKRGGNGNLRNQSDVGASPRDDRQRHSDRTPPSVVEFYEKCGQDRLPNPCVQWTSEQETSPSPANTTTPRRGSGVSDPNNLPAGAEARAQVLHSSPPAAAGLAVSPSRKLPLVLSDPPVRENFTPTTGRLRGLPVDVGAGRTAGSSPSWRSQSESSDRLAGGNFTPRTEMRKGSLDDVGTSVEPDALFAPIIASRSPCLGSRRGATQREVVCCTDIGKKSCESGMPAASSASPVGRASLLAPTNEAPLMTRSSLVPVGSSTMFPATAGFSALSLCDDESKETTLECAATGEVGTTPVVASLTTDSASRDVPQDVIDAFLTSWQMEHLRKRDQRETLAAEPDPRQSKAVSRPTGLGAIPAVVATSAPFHALRESRATGEIRSGHGFANGREGKHPLASKSRVINSSPPSLPPVEEEMEWGDQEGVGVCAEEGEQPLASDSVLFYLTGLHQQDSPGVSRSISRIATGIDDPASEQGEVDQDQMSPLTRLLAETPVKLPVDANHATTAQHHGPFSVDGGGGNGNDKGNDDPGISGTAREARARWRDRTWGGGAVAEAMKRGGGETAWEEISDIGASSSGP